MNPNKVLSPETQETLALVTDPYHDFQLRIKGYPDGTRNMTTQRRIFGNATITCPFTLAANETWSFHVFTSPIHYRTSFKFGDILAYDAIQSYQFQELGPLNIVYIHYASDGRSIGQAFTSLGEFRNDTNANTSTRTVSLGFEIHDQTAELYRGGSLAVYRTNAHDESLSMSVSDKDGTGAIQQLGLHYMKHLVTYPKTRNEAALLSSYKSWELSKGCYSVSLPGPANHYSSKYNQNVFVDYGSIGGSCWYTEIPPGSATTSCPSWSPLSCTGVFSSILDSNHFSYDLTFRQVLEVAPDAQNSLLLTFAGTAPPCDKTFLNLYREMYTQIPAGVPVGFNDMGTWFKMVMQIAKENLPAAIGLLPPNLKAPAAALLPVAQLALDKGIRKLEAREQAKIKNNTNTQTSKPKPDVSNRMMPANRAKKL